METPKAFASRPPLLEGLFFYNHGRIFVGGLEEMSGHLGRHPNATVRCAIARDKTCVHAVAASEAQEVRHFCTIEDCSRRLGIFSNTDIFFHDGTVFINVIAVLARDVVCVFLNHAIFAGRRFVTFSSGRDVRFADEMFTFVKIGALFVEVNDDFRPAAEIIAVPISAPGMRRRERGP